MHMENRFFDGRHYCPFCSHEIRHEDVLFVDVDQLGSAGDADYDPEYAKFMSRVLDFRSIEAPDGQTLQMESRPVYRFHRWSRPRDTKLPFWAPEHISQQEGRAFPDDIHVLRAKGMTPRQLSGDEPAPWAKVSAADTPEPTPAAEAPEKQLSTSDILRQMMLGSLTGQSAIAAEEIPAASVMPEDAAMTLTDKACPHCHCILPEGFGYLPMYRVSMLGGTASGKTTYMVAAANLLSHQSGLPSGIISGCEICKESKRYFNFLIRCLEYNKLEATIKDDVYTVQFVFPIVMNVTTIVGDPENPEEKEFLLIINDIPGEGMEDKTFLLTYPGLCQANAAIMLIDPFQFISNNAVKNELARNDLEALNRGKEITPEDVRKHRDRFTPSTFASTLSNAKKMVGDGKFQQLQCFSFVLNKLDLLYGGNRPLVSVQQDKDRQLVYINGQYDLDKQHRDGLDLEYLEQLSEQVIYLISNKLGYKEYETNIMPIVNQLWPVHTFCISIRSWNDGAAAFTTEADENGKTEAANIIGFRMLEPLLYSLYRLGLVRGKGQEASPAAAPASHWWNRLFGRN